PAGWPAVALVGACGFLLGVVLVLGLGLGRDPAPPAHTVTRTVVAAATTTTGGTVIVTTHVPPVVGERLDVAKARLARARFDVDVDGGGVLGVVREPNWEVVAQDPGPGVVLEQGSSVHLVVERR
ncbi:MAG: PASTA domain-containing protein, partial [Actinomycetota bacterium]|nr:PASTA domain-containing protein [Actinomycetota bacterium]